MINFTKELNNWANDPLVSPASKKFFNEVITHIINIEKDIMRLENDQCVAPYWSEDGRSRLCHDVTDTNKALKLVNNREMALRIAIKQEIKVLRIPIHDPFIEDKSKPYVPAPEWKLIVASNLQRALSPLEVKND